MPENPMGEFLCTESSYSEDAEICAANRKIIEARESLDRILGLYFKALKKIDAMKPYLKETCPASLLVDDIPCDTCTASNTCDEEKKARERMSQNRIFKYCSSWRKKEISECLKKTPHK